MMLRMFFSTAIFLFHVTTAHAQICTSGNDVTNPDTFVWKQVDTANGTYYFGTLEMGAAEFTINGQTLITRAYRQEGGEYSIPGPTIRMVPGNKYVLRFKNTLPFEPFNHEHNVFRNPNVTNVHTHGLHISGESPGDDVTRFFEGGFGGDYVYDIPENHMGGGYWYHAHHHGATFLQVSTGAFGLIFIEDTPDDMIPANVSNMEEKHLVLGFLEPNNAAGTGGDTLIGGDFSDGWTINGTVNGNVCVPEDTWQNWRMLVADQDSRLVDLAIGEGCEVALMARDGVWRNEVPRLLTNNTLTLTGASRADLAVRCRSDSTISVAGTQVANVIVQPGTPNTGVHPYDADGISTWSAERPDYLRDLRLEPFVAGSQTIRMGARTVLGRKFDPDVANIEETADGVQEWSIKGATNHPFHLHIYHVQVQSDCGPYEAGEFYDVIAGNCDLRFDMSDAEAFQGRTIFHCHILEHEDQGAMAWMDVTGGRLPPKFPTDEGFTFYDYYQFGDTGGSPPAAPSNLGASAASSSQINLDWLDNSSDEASFKIERSADGVTFDPHDTVGADVTSYSDINLSPLTTYYYQVAAANAAGNSAFSNIASATTQAGGGTATDLVVASVSVSTQNAGRGEKVGQADVTIVDDLGNPVDKAFVNGEFSGQITESVEDAQTDANGNVTTVTSQRAKPLNALTFCVTSVVAPTDSALNNYTGPALCASL